MTLVVVFMGVSGSGKSTIASALAKKLGLPFIEGDEFHSVESKQKMESRIALDDSDRWPWLDALGGAINREASSHSVVTTCSALKRSYRDRLRQTVDRPLLFVYLSAEPNVLAQRLMARQGHFMPASLLDSQLETLEVPAEDECDAVKITSAGVDDMMQDALHAIAAAELAC